VSRYNRPVSNWVSLEREHKSGLRGKGMTWKVNYFRLNDNEYQLKLIYQIRRRYSTLAASMPYKPLIRN